jgi:hypothetical protein
MAPIAFTSEASIQAMIRCGTTAGRVCGCLALAQAHAASFDPLRRQEQCS